MADVFRRIAARRRELDRLGAEIRAAESRLTGLEWSSQRLIADQAADRREARESLAEGESRVVDGFRFRKVEGLFWIDPAPAPEPEPPALDPDDAAALAAWAKVPFDVSLCD